MLLFVFCCFFFWKIKKREMLQNVICCSCDWYLKSCGPPFFIGQIYAQRHVRINSELLSIETDLVNETTADSHYIHNFIRMGFLSKRVLILKTLIKTEAEDIFFFFFFSEKNKTWHFMWIFCSADNSHEMSCLILSEKYKKWMSFATVLLNA